MKYTIEEVLNEKQANEFLLLPVALYKHDENWVRPLDSDIKKVFNPEKNLYFKHGECTRWLLRDENGRCVGRVASFVDQDICRMDSYTVGGMGFFECINDQEAAFMLFDRCQEWLKERGMESMEGPVNFGERNEWWGLLVKGFKHPVFQMSYTPEYYISFFENYGFRDYFQQYIYRTRLAMESLAPVVIWKSDRLLKNGDYQITCFREMTPDRVKSAFFEIYNQAWNANVHGVGGMTWEQVNSLYKTMRPLLDPDLLYFAYYKDRPIGFFIMIPDLNYLLKHVHGTFSGMGALKFLYYRYIKRSRLALGLIFGVISDFQGRGVEAALIKCACESVVKKKGRYDSMDLTWVGDFNPQMMHLMEYIGAVKSQTYITYRKLFRDDIVFCRSADKLKKQKTIDN